MPPSLRRFLASVGRCNFEGLLMADNLAHSKSSCCALLPFPDDCWLIRCDVGQVAAIDVLPDDALLAIFDFCVVGYQDMDPIDVMFDVGLKRVIESWQSLVHVCRRWRGLVLGSPRRLNLQLCWMPRGTAMKSLDIWPSLPLHIQGKVPETSVDDIMAELEHSDRIRKINLRLFTSSRIEELCKAMEVSFPDLEFLLLSFGGLPYRPDLPDSFLGGSVPRLRYLHLDSIPFPGLPKLLLSAAHLSRLYLENIPHSGYISPEAMATSLSVLTRLEILQLFFESPQSCPDQEIRRPPPPTPSILSTLTSFWFKGVQEYLEELVAQIDAPRLHALSITFFNDIDFDTPELNQFISRTPIFGAYDASHLIFHSHSADLRLESHPEPSDHRRVNVRILCQVSGWQLSSLAQICTLLRLLLTTEDLFIYEGNYPSYWEGDIENTEWLDLLLPFTAVKNLYLSKEFAPRIAPALQELTGVRTTEVLPVLQNVFLEGFHPSEPVQEGIARFISARHLTNHPVAHSAWK